MDIDLTEFFTQADTRCVIGKTLEQMSLEDRTKFQAAMDHPDISLVSLCGWLSKRGVKTTTTTVGTHRRGQCRCD
jgi:hypothetical protein